jgi:hypothetical protein
VGCGRGDGHADRFAQRAATAMTAAIAKTRGFNAIEGFMVILRTYFRLSVETTCLGQSATRTLKVLAMRFPTPAL